MYFFYYPRPSSNFTCQKPTILNKLTLLTLVQVSTDAMSYYCFVLFSCVLFYCFFLFVLIAFVSMVQIILLVKFLQLFLSAFFVLQFAVYVRFKQVIVKVYLKNSKSYSVQVFHLVFK